MDDPGAKWRDPKWRGWFYVLRVLCIGWLAGVGVAAYRSLVLGIEVQTATGPILLALATLIVGVLKLGFGRNGNGANKKS